MLACLAFKVAEQKQVNLELQLVPESFGALGNIAWNLHVGMQAIKEPKPQVKHKKIKKNQRVIWRESKTDSYSKDLLFLACVAFCVITFEPIMI